VVTHNEPRPIEHGKESEPEKERLNPPAQKGKCRRKSGNQVLGLTDSNDKVIQSYNYDTPREHRKHDERARRRQYPERRTV
jgi:hypothetical protein